MGFWIYMLLMNLLITFTLIGFGKYFMKKAPKEINGVFGYRTSMSMKNKDTWEFAHKYCGKIWYLCGLISLPITVIPMLLVVEKNVDVVGTVGAIITGVQLVFLIGSIFPTEIALRKNFDKNGERRSHGIDQVKRME
ncbi:SdpI family protein [Blautia hydrogenotrophica]|uniref:SdpI family protein n=1 Tax=Blautia hydrogenotrophica TaxID=53443 RepID=UPI003AB1272E